MAKKSKQCRNCKFWKGTAPEKNICSELKVGTDVFISGMYLQTASTFGCMKYKERENDTNTHTVSADSNNN